MVVALALAYFSTAKDTMPKAPFAFAEQHRSISVRKTSREG